MLPCRPRITRACSRGSYDLLTLAPFALAVRASKSPGRRRPVVNG
nr:Hypothetical protein [Pseudomonas aeruginosa]